MHAESTFLSTTPSVRLGMLTPSSNTALEPLTQALLSPIADRVSAHFGRFRVTQIALDDVSNQQFRQEPILAAADLLADAKPSVIAWNGTSASWLGFDRDDALCAEITRRTGVPATSAIVSLNRLIVEHGVRRLGLVTPYTPDVQSRIVANYASIGVEIPAEAHAGLTENFAFAEIDERRVAEMCRAAAAPGVDAVAVVCTNMRGPMAAAALERELGVTILDSIAVTLWGCLKAAGVSTAPLARFGRLFAEGPDLRAAG
jgi:maleate isomerase